MIEKALTMILLSAIALPGASAYAGERPGFAFLNTEMDARASGVAGAMIASRADLLGLLHNPASLGALRGWEWSASYVNYILNVSGGSLLLAGETDYGVAGLAVSSMDYGDFNRLDIDGNDLGGSFGASDLLISGGFVRELLVGLSAGLNVKGIFSRIEDYSASAFALDAGVIYHDAGRELTVGGGIFSIGRSSAFVETTESLPTTFRGGFSKKLAHLPLTLSFEGIYFTYGDWKLLGGGEILVSEQIKLRVGLDSNRFDITTDTLPEDTFSGLSFGLGLKHEKLRFDYAYSSFGGAGSIMRFGVSGVF